MKKRFSRMGKRKKWVLSGLFLSACACLVAIPLTANATTADGFTDFSVEDTLTFNSAFTLPEVAYIHNGNSIRAYGELKYPDGTISTKKNNTLDVAGNYEITYSATVDGTLYRETECFSVSLVNYYVQDASSKVEYGEYNGIEGLYCDMLCGDTLHFTKIIDLSDATATEPILDLFAIPTTAGSPDFQVFDIYLTDIYDESNVMHIKVHHGNSVSRIKGRIMGTGQALSGAEADGYGGKYVHVNNTYGYPYSTFHFAPKANYQDCNLQLGYDSVDKSLHAIKRGASYLFTEIIDFDDFEHFSHLWEGFTTGEVRLSITPSNGTRARFFISEVKGVDLETTEYEDTSKPMLYVDTQGYETLPNALVGCPYPLFNATAFDYESGRCDVFVKVWKNYYSSVKTTQALKNGTFTPNTEGKYTLEYIAQDFFGNTQTQYLDIYASSENSFEIAAPNLPASGKAGLKVYFGEFVTTGNHGDVIYDIEVKKDGKAVSVENDGFIPTAIGEYEITVYGKDYASVEAKRTYVIEIVANDTPIIETVKLPKYFATGRTYQLPIPQAVDYSENGAAIATKVSVVRANGTEMELVDGKYTPAIPQASNGVEEVRIKYMATGKNGSSFVEYNTKVCKVTTEDNAIDTAKYFYCENVSSAVVEDKYATYTVNNASQMEFINALPSLAFELEFGVSNKKGQVNVLLVDDVDNSKYLKLGFDKNGTLSINGEQFTFTFSKGVLDKIVQLKYDAETKTVIVNNKNYPVSRWWNGERFEGFTGNYLSLRFTFEGYEEGIEDQFYLCSLCNQYFDNNNKATDRGKPIIVELGDYGGITAYNSLSKILDVFYIDVLNGCRATVTVIAPNGDYVKTVDGVILNEAAYSNAYMFKCEQYGAYNVEIIAKDDVGRKENISYIVNVANYNAPTILFEQTAFLEYYEGVFTIPAVSILDDTTNSGDVKLLVYLKEQTGLVRSANVGEKVTLKKGHYTLTYIAIDKDGNYTFYDYSFTVVEK